ncbi:hypothetical protein [Stieleria marina]|uniref:Cytochrome C n=1 Tax=Stieleria marina TaxID=1930275 RepID=A0A517NXN4_9BACT|nr:hypothetical protein K239x_38970 [Planctomycetes bacterium K23_9]
MRWIILTTAFFAAIPVLVAQVPAVDRVDKIEETAVDERPLDFWMQKKLDYSSGILKGLALSDFKLIETSAQQMRVLNKVEGFARSRNKNYRLHLRSFERVTDEVIRHAKNQNVDGVALAYNHLTVSCIRCHQSLRKPDVTLDLSPNARPVTAPDAIDQTKPR